MLLTVADICVQNNTNQQFTSLLRAALNNRQMVDVNLLNKHLRRIFLFTVSDTADTCSKL